MVVRWPILAGSWCDAVCLGQDREHPHATSETTAAVLHVGMVRADVLRMTNSSRSCISTWVPVGGLWGLQVMGTQVVCCAEISLVTLGMLLWSPCAPLAAVQATSDGAGSPRDAEPVWLLPSQGHRKRLIA